VEFKVNRRADYVSFADGVFYLLPGALGLAPHFYFAQIGVQRQVIALFFFGGVQM